MDRLRLWRYKKLANNENVKPEEKVIDDEDYNSCFQLKKTLKKSCKKLLNNSTKSNHKVTTEDITNVAMEEQKIIKKLREQQNHKQKAEKSQQTLHKCLDRILRKSSAHHQRLEEVQDENINISHDEYVASGIYEVFGHSCTDSFTTNVITSKQVEAEDLSSNSWYQSGLLGKFSLEMLKHQSPGSFIIHKGSHKSVNFILSLRIPTNSTAISSNRRSKSKNLAHYLILHSKKGYRIKGAKKFFPTISSLVTHHSVMSESLPVTLMVERNLVVKNDDDFSSIEDLKFVFTDLEEF